MLKVIIPADEYYDEDLQEFKTINKDYTLQLEHSLLSVSKWESKYHKSFIDDSVKTDEETIDYIRCMTINQNVPEEVYDHIPSSVIYQVKAYIDDKMTATTFSSRGEEAARKKRSKERITSELVYYWMIVHNIPFSCEKWHFNRLLTLIEICERKSGGDSKMKPKQTAEYYAGLNAARRKAMHSKG